MLSPARRSEAGYRLYGADDIARLQQIMSLRQMGFSLEDIGALLDRPDCSPARLIELHLVRVREQIALQERLRQRLEALASYLEIDGDMPVDAFLQTMIPASRSPSRRCMSKRARRKPAATCSTKR